MQSPPSGAREVCTWTKWANAVFLMALLSGAIYGQVNVGEQKPEANLPFNMTTVTTFEFSWRLVFCLMAACSLQRRSGPFVW